MKHTRGTFASILLLAATVAAFLASTSNKEMDSPYLRELARTSRSQTGLAQNHSPPPPASSKSALGIIQLGQCHGEDLERILRKHQQGADDISEHAAPAEQQDNALAKHSYQIYHHMPQSSTLNDHSIWIALVRDPIDRLVATFNYEHVQNQPFRRYPKTVSTSDEQKLAKKKKLYQCYETMDHLANNGLTAALQLADRDDECASLVRDLFENQNPFPDMTDFKLNYGHYYQSLVDASAATNKDKPTIYIVRTEHMIHDLNKINIMMGGRKSNVYDNDEIGSIGIGSPTPALLLGQHQHQGQVPQQHPSPYWKNSINDTNLLPLSSTYLSKESLNNLCRVLCHEIELYQQLVHLGANVQSAELAGMTLDLRRKCGADIMWRQQQARRGLVTKLSMHPTRSTNNGAISICCPVDIWNRHVND